ncbi:TIGR01777 family oxidoreductase [Halobacillus karajensis]|uniref:Epimerase family protein n=1 Tax=Halobacillus karajensis TaxID=195088 RepID=A0A024P9D0_9BACI|nr:TIGR01777 family oxidoreductase [Halobacillus karajensis]CDQ20307.1 Epimerase family protein [Halobacillus karajensis]CDQ25032.1 Epimerase family protein [Halobacillus karajensis]CDQ28607.1 Epimerase family protein [Halobacillus karajensis]
MKKVVLAGGTGFIGEYFQRRYKEMGYTVEVISRKKGYRSWDDKEGIIEALEEADILINLAGKSVNCRYHTKNKNEIMISRIVTTTILGEAIRQCENPPEVWMNSSTATIYRHAEDRPMTENEGEIGSGFSVDVATNWEENFFAIDLPATRKIALRTAIVLGENGGVMTPYRNLVKFGLGGVQGSGKQMFSWIHVEDLFRITWFLKGNKKWDGVFNCSSPNPVTNDELMRQMRGKAGRNFGLSAPKWMLEIGSALIRTETELVLKSRWVVPERLEKAGFEFKYPTLEKTLDEII